MMLAYQPIRSLATINMVVFSGAAGAKRIYNVIDQPIKISDDKNFPDLKLSEGEFIGLVGPSGSGKTTLLNIIGGLDSATEGSVSVLGNSMDNTSHKERAIIRRKHM